MHSSCLIELWNDYTLRKERRRRKGGKQVHVVKKGEKEGRRKERKEEGRERREEGKGERRGKVEGEQSSGGEKRVMMEKEGNGLLHGTLTLAVCVVGRGSVGRAAG